MGVNNWTPQSVLTQPPVLVHTVYLASVIVITSGFNKGLVINYRGGATKWAPPPFQVKVKLQALVLKLPQNVLCAPPPLYGLNIPPPPFFFQRSKTESPYSNCIFKFPVFSPFFPIRLNIFPVPIYVIFNYYIHKLT